MANFNNLPVQASPATSDKVFSARGTAVGAEQSVSLLAIQTLFETAYDARYAAFAGGSGIVTVGTITSGVWNGSAISSAYLTLTGITAGSGPAPGIIGESGQTTLSSITSVPNATATIVSSVSLAAGKYILTGWGSINPGNTNNILTIGLSTTSASIPGNLDDGTWSSSLPATQATLALMTPPVIYNFSTTTSVYLNAYFSYTGGAAIMYGLIRWLRVG